MKALRSIASVSLALALILSVAGFSVSRHYCLGMLAGESFYHLGNESCGMTSGTCEAFGHQFSTHCCENENISIPGIQVDERINEDDFDSPQKVNPPSFITVDAIAQDIVFTKSSVFPAHAPPDGGDPSGRDILIHYQRFLI